MLPNTKKRTFAAIVCLLLVPIFLFGTLFVSQSLKDIAFAKSELNGVNALRPVVTALHNAATSIEDPKVIEDLNKLDLSEFKVQFELKNLNQTYTSKESSINERVAAAAELISVIGDQSKLILDPDLDSYYTMDVVVLRIPELLSNLGAMRLDHFGHSHNEVDVEFDSQVTLAITGLQSTMTGLEHSLARAFQNNEDGITRTSLSASANSLARETKTFVELTHITPGHSSQTEHTFFKDHAASQRAIQRLAGENLKFWRVASVELERLLKKRVNALQNRLYVASLAACVVALLALVIAISFFRGLLSKLDEEIVFLAHHDPLTRLSNRMSLNKEIDKAIINARVAEMPCAVHLIDLDRFKAINDTLGHAYGDEVIRIMARRLKEIAGKNDMVGRLGGDELVVLQREAPSAAIVATFAERIVTAMREPFQYGEHTAQASASVGVAMAPQHGSGYTELLVSADLALYAAKNDGRDRFHFFTPELENESRERARIESEIRRSIDENAFDIEFQPQYDVEGKVLRGFEALLRMSDRDGKRISPAIFIPVAEQIGLISAIGADVLERACAFAASWPNELTLSVNLSPAQFRDGNVPGVIALALTKSKLVASRLTVEITEGLLLESSPQVLQQIDEIRQMGVCIAIDDFGTGYSNLAYLAQHRFDKIKIDRSLIKGITSQQSSIKEVIRTIINMGRSMNMVVVAEGVETQEQATAMLDMECHEIQGFLYGKPQPVTEVANTILRSSEVAKARNVSTNPITTTQKQPRDFLEYFTA
jgi:diguanylate cyclase (GGDEF)-like protein